jgi:DNA-binding Lrp family transcriptional regulator
VLKPQDILVLLKLAAETPSWTFDSLARELGLSASAVHRSLQRAEAAGLYDGRRRKIKPAQLLEFLAHGLQYVYPAEWSGEARGRPTAWGAPPLSGQLVSSANPPVWPDANGKVRGLALKPLHPAVPGAADRDERLWELLALVDAIRIGNARERSLATRELKKRLNGDWSK